MCLTLLVSGAGQANAGLLYGLSTDAPTSGLYTIDPNTGAATLLLSLPYRTNPSGLTFLNGQLSASNVAVDSSGRRQTGTIDLQTGMFTAISDQGGSTSWHGLAGNNAANVLYTAEGGNTGLFSVTPTGVITGVGYPGLPALGLEYDNKHGILYAVTVDPFYTIDVVTGAATSIGPTGIGFSARVGLAYDEDNDILYANATRQFAPSTPLVHQLFRVDVHTGAFTLVGNNGLDVTIDGLAWGPAAAPVPAPSTLTLVSLGILGLLGYNWRRRRWPRGGVGFAGRT